ncbi:MAG: thioredoxin domain-containing protein [Methylacidiphilales bacterium]|nr:thioredoxin domain-containing protein [Candidatus Methylacidiphilales bacterium]
MSTKPLPNRLAREKSPYLLQHARNPVDWFPWGKEAFAKARAEDKPIFLSVGYSTCHWCHVMEHESFESAAIAAFLNEHFVSIKVDREERPDVDQVYMTFVQATTGHGGWPMSVWLTPELRPFTGGTYFPPTDVPGRPGFITVLRRIAELWKSDRKQIEDKAGSLLSALREAETEVIAPGADEWDSAKAVELGLNQYAQMFDSREGGFGGAPKFPRPVNLQFLLHLAAKKEPTPQDADTARGMALFTLRKMAAGGMHDHLGGGFHRYSVDAEWHVPHFEKMLYDQAQLAQVYLAAHQISGDAVFARVARNILQYVEHDLTSPEGAFFSAEDADSLPRKDAAKKSEGAFYVWTRNEIGEVLGEDRVEEFCATYGVEPNGNVNTGSDPQGELEGINVLIQRLTPAGAAAHFQRSLENMEHRLSDDRSALLARRGLRPRPHLDDKVLTAWNGLMIGAFARAAQVLVEESHLLAAQRAAIFLKKNLFDSAKGELLRSYREGPSAIRGFAVDYAFLISGLLDLYETDFDLDWLRWARQLQDTLDLHFWDQERSGYFSTSDHDPEILLRIKEDYDGAEPTPNSVAAINLWRLGQIFHNDVFLEHARHAVRAFSSRLEAQPFAMPLLMVAASLLKTPPVHLIIHSPRPDHPRLGPLVAEARRRYLPHLVVILIADDEARNYFASRHEVIENLPAKAATPTAYLCEDYTCRLPVTEPEELREIIAEL